MSEICLVRVVNERNKVLYELVQYKVNIIKVKLGFITVRSKA